MNKLSIIFFLFCSLLWAFGCGYWFGHKNQKIQYITKEIEVVKKVTQKRAIIQSRPNITRDNALKLMRQDKL